MKLSIFNGSPRGKNSNTSKLLQHFQNGFIEAGGAISDVDLLIMEKHLDEQVQRFKEADNILLAFPLYVDSVPGIVKQFIEAIGSFDGTGKNIYFLVHCGFPEAIHLEALARYLELLTKRWKMNHCGIIIKPGTEQIRMRKEQKNKKLFSDFETLGRTLAETGKFDQQILDKFKALYVFPERSMPVVRLLFKTGILDTFWKREMKKNGVLSKSFDTPLIN